MVAELKWFRFVYSQSARYRLVEQKYTSNNQTQTHI